MSDLEPRRRVTITLSHPFVDAHDDATLEAYADAVVAAAHESHHLGQQAMMADLAGRMDAIGIRLPDLELRNLAEELRTFDGHVEVLLPEGSVLRGNGPDDPTGGDAVPSSEREPQVVGSEDPASPERPLYS